MDWPLQDPMVRGYTPGVNGTRRLVAPSMSPTTLGRDIDIGLGGWVHNNTRLPSQAAAISGPIQHPTNLPVLPSSASKPHACEVVMCSSRFLYKKDLKRHIKTVHKGKNDPVFRCRCGKEEVRKDNYSRHIKSCDKENLYSTYTCQCGFASKEREEHMSHVKDCQHGFGRTGRPGSGS
ncbi:hypothetical protein CHU98_g2775 [Xylaria longipes]|nr:hypothetical protein CHU98_g2775 [Xylaria longipes]